MSYYFQELQCYTGLLGQGEDLYIAAKIHQDELGCSAEGVRFTALELAAWLLDSVLPWNYSGSIYLTTEHEAARYADALSHALGINFTDRVHTTPMPRDACAC